jgi:hypothetical protein
MTATAQGKEHALAELARRRALFKDRPHIDNSRLYAGDPMYYGCIGCNAIITVPEDWLTRPKMCPECQALHDLGWLV